jgi:hypothetical protein
MTFFGDLGRDLGCLPADRVLHPSPDIAKVRHRLFFRLLRALRAELRVSALSASVAGADSKLFDRKRNGALKMRRARENDFFLTI